MFDDRHHLHKAMALNLPTVIEPFLPGAANPLISGWSIFSTLYFTVINIIVYLLCPSPTPAAASDTLL